MGENNYYWLRRKQVKDYDTSVYENVFDKLPTNMPDNGSYQIVCCFIAIPKDLLCYTTQPEPVASDPKCSHILQSDMKETVENKSTTGFLQREPKESESNIATTYLLYSWILWRFHEEYYNKFRWSEISVWIWKYTFPTKEVCYYHKWRLEFTYQVSKSKYQYTAIFYDAYTNTFSYIQTHVIDESQPESIIYLHE